MYRMQICFGFKNFFFFFLRPNLEFWPVFTKTPEIFSKWNRNTLDKVPGVATVIDPQTNTWNDNLVDSIFLPFEAQKVKAIPLCITNQPDCLFWPKSNDGSYTVSSGYQWLCSEENSSASSVSNPERCRNF